MTAAQPCSVYPGGYPAAFCAFHDANPGVYEAIVWHARELKRRGFTGVGMRYLFEHERYNRKRDNSRTVGIETGLNNNFATFYGRLVEAQEDDLEGFFRLRAIGGERAAKDACQGVMEFD